MNQNEIIFEVTGTVEGGYNAKVLGYSIFTQGQDWAELKSMVKDAVLCHFDDGGATKIIRLHHQLGDVVTGKLDVRAAAAGLPDDCGDSGKVSEEARA